MLSPVKLPTYYAAMPRKIKKPRNFATKITRQLSSPTKSVPKKNKKEGTLPRSSHSASEIFRNDSNIDHEEMESPPPGGSRPTSPISVLLPIFENGFSWPRIRGPFKGSKKPRAPLLVSPDSGYASSPSPVGESSKNVVCEKNSEEEMFHNCTENELPVNRQCENVHVRSMSPIENELQGSSSNIARGSLCSSPLSDKENDIDAVIASLDNVIDDEVYDEIDEDQIVSCDEMIDDEQELRSKKDSSDSSPIESKYDDKVDAAIVESKYDDKVDAAIVESKYGEIDAAIVESNYDNKVDANAFVKSVHSDGTDDVREDPNDKEVKDVLGELPNGIIKDGKGTFPKKVRFRIDHQPIRRTKSCDIFRNLVDKEPCNWNITVKKVDIYQDKNNPDLSIGRVLDSFITTVCHHPECTLPNGFQPLLLCKECDQNKHGSSRYSGHLVLNAPKKKLAIARGTSAPVLPHFDGNHSDSEASDRRVPEGEYNEDSVDGIYMKKTESAEFRVPATAAELKLKRKKAMKLKRRHTDDGRRLSIPMYDSDDESESSDHGHSDQGHSSDLENKTGSQIKRSNSYRRKSDDTEHGSLAQRRNSKSVISDEYFTVVFTSKNGENADMEIVAAIKGVSLRAALQPILERRGFGINGVNVFVEASKTPLPLDCEAFLLGGNTLKIKEKEDCSAGGKSLAGSRPGSGNKSQSSKGSKGSGMSRRESFFGRAPAANMLEPPAVKQQRRNSLSFPFFAHPTPKVAASDATRVAEDVGSMRNRRGINLSIDESLQINPSLSSSVSPQGTLSYSEGKKIKERSKLTNLLSPMSKDREKQEQLSELLNGYSANGIPPMPDLLTLGQQTHTPHQFEIEGHWSALVDNASSLNKRQHDQQEAIWELLQTEVHYNKSLCVITDLFMCCLINLQAEQLLNEIDTERLFCNIRDIANGNAQFWENSLNKVLQSTRESRLPLNSSDMKEGFKQFADYFSPYTKYCMEQKTGMEYTKARYSDNELFKTFVVWAETQKQCNRLKLTDLLVKPMQRLTKYSLLLQAILRKTDEEVQRKDLLEMIASVDRFVSHVNASLRQRHEQEHLATIMTKIESYEAVEAPNDESLKYLQEYNMNFDLRAPMPGCSGGQTRSLIMQSVLRLKDSTTRLDVECLLFTDLLLICKPSKRMEKYRIIKPPMRVDRIITQELKDKGSFLMIYLNEYHVPVSAFTFHADQAAIRVWLEKIRKAQELYREVRTSVQSHDSFSYLNIGEVVEEQVIGVTPLHPTETADNQPDLVMSRSASHESTGNHFLFPGMSQDMPSPGRISPATVDDRDNQSPVEPDSQNVLKSRSYHGHEIQSRTFEDVSSQSEKRHKPVQSSYSVPSFVESVSNNEDRLKIPSSNVSSANSDSSLPDIVDDNLKGKLSQRRSSRSGRYITADSIQDLNKDDKDTSIYKRLSWNFGTMESNDDRQGVLKSKTQSSDSLRSVHSSSGVSSTGSLHLSPEEIELNHGDISTIPECRQVNDINEDDLLTKDSKTDDINHLFKALSAGEIKEGIVSIDLPNMEKKLSHAQILRMKKQLLLTSDVEASEV